MTPAQHGIDVICTDECPEQGREGEQDQNCKQCQRHLERRQSGVKQGNVPHILVGAVGIADTVVVMMRVTVVMMPMRMVVGHLGKADVPGPIRVNMYTAQLQHYQAKAGSDYERFAHATHMLSIHNCRPADASSGCHGV